MENLKTTSKELPRVLEEKLTEYFDSKQYTEDLLEVSNKQKIASSSSKKLNEKIDNTQELKGVIFNEDKTKKLGECLDKFRKDFSNKSELKQKP